MAPPRDDFHLLPCPSSCSEIPEESVAQGQQYDVDVINRKLMAKTASFNNIEDEGKQQEVLSGNNKPSNEQVLNVAFFSFVGFMAVQAVFALIAHSKSMLADSEAMSVDAITYLFNLCAERIKNRAYTAAELLLGEAERDYRREMRRLYLEMIPPSLSVMVLIVITILTLQEAWNTLFGQEADGVDDDIVSVPIMLCFSGLNLLLDMVNVTFFARADMNFGLSVVRKEQGLIRQTITTPIDMDTELGQAATKNDEKRALLSPGASTYGSSDNGGGDDDESTVNEDEDEDNPGMKKVLVNLNMCSAWTHVCADTLRSTAVLVAAFIATIFPSIDGAVADSLAAIVVSVVILLSLIPLIQGLVLTALNICELRRNRPISL